MRLPFLDDGDARLYVGDCIEVMAEMDAESVDAVVCDPPYGISFMGKEWDSGAMLGQMAEGDEKRGALAYGGSHSRGYADNDNVAFQSWCETWAREALRVLKPGGHLLAFGGTRTFHRLTVGIEDAGLEIRDSIAAWLYGSGFPKSLDVSKAIDKAAGAERELVAEGAPIKRMIPGADQNATGSWIKDNGRDFVPQVTAPATDAAREWQGWGTALKPAWEPCVVARKPLAGTVAENVQAHGTGALNVDGCRIGTDAVQVNTYAKRGPFGDSQVGKEYASKQTQGRWPANVVLDEQAAAMLDAQSGESTRVSRWATTGSKASDNRAMSGGNTHRDPRPNTACGPQYDDTGGASRFYYTAKASRADRSTNGANNTHPTVKPTDLMRWLVRLVTPPGGVVLDPFAGSGTTLVAARAEGVRCIGIEREDEYAQIIVKRLSQLSLLSDDHAA